ncbi:MAG: TIGR04086 family membrane protein [Clostridia bacterium]|nr:TIGR04086 family membrane protein [Clostridia bacterium]
MRRYKKTKRNTKHGSIGWKVFQAALLSCFAVLAMLLLTTMMLAWGWIKEDSITLINTIVKIIGALTAGLLAGKSSDRPWLAGGVAAIVFMILSITCMSLLLSEFSFTWGLVGDILMSAVVGGAAAQITRMLKRPRDA